MSDIERTEIMPQPSLSMGASPVAPRPMSLPDSGADCPTCASPGTALSAPSFVYAIGSISPRFPLLSVEKELAQVTGRASTDGLTDRQALHRVLTRAENRYLVRQLCWVMTIEGLETYILMPRDPGDWSLLVETLRATPRPADVDVVIGIKGPIAPPTLCNGLMVPIVIFDHIYSFDTDSLLGSIPKPEGMKAEQFKAVTEEVYNRITHMADNAGDADEHRALNYLIVRYPALYHRVAQAHLQNAGLSAVEARPSSLSGTRRILDVIFSFTNRATDVVEKFFTRVDVTEQFPFLVTKMSPYFDR